MMNNNNNAKRQKMAIAVGTSSGGSQVIRSPAGLERNGSPKYIRGAKYNQRAASKEAPLS
jgi:hypothetical protein